MRITALITGALLLLATSAVQAQQGEAPSNNASIREKLEAPAVAPAAAPRLTVAEQERIALANTPANAPVIAARGRSIAYMVAGGALFVAGAIIGNDAGTLMMVGGAVMGAYGLFLHFR